MTTIHYRRVNPARLGVSRFPHVEHLSTWIFLFRLLDLFQPFLSGHASELEVCSGEAVEDRGPGYDGWMGYMVDERSLGFGQDDVDSAISMTQRYQREQLTWLARRDPLEARRVSTVNFGPRTTPRQSVNARLTSSSSGKTPVVCAVLIKSGHPSFSFQYPPVVSPQSCPILNT